MVGGFEGWHHTLKAMHFMTGDANGGGKDDTGIVQRHLPWPEWGMSTIMTTDNATPDDHSPQPSSVVGEFNANFSDGAVAGGFGARVKK